MRASKYAEGPIRQAFVQILDIMEKRCPVLFQPWVYEKVWDGIDAKVPPRDKL